MGLVHEFEPSLEKSRATVRPRESVMEKAKSTIRQFLQTNKCTPAQASKLRGVVAFLFNGAYGRLGRAHLRPILQRESTLTDGLTER